MKKIILIFIAAIVLFAGCTVTPRPVVRTDLEATVQIRFMGPLSLVRDGRDGPFQAVAGIQGQRIEPADVIITFRNERLRETIRQGTDASAWITNLPRGLIARVKEANENSNRIIITVEGTPQITLNQEIRFSFPASLFQQGRSSAFAFNSEEAKFEILQGRLTLTELNRPAAPAINFVRISGTVGSSLGTTDLRVDLFETSLQEAITEETTIDWITNSPAGLRVTVQPALAGARELYLTIRGTPQEARNDAVAVTIPGFLLGDVTDFDVPNETILWDIIGGWVSDSLINGSVGSNIVSRDIYINLLGTVFSQDIASGTEVNSIISNLPRGLIARVRWVRAGQSSAIITISGIPLEISTEVLSIEIPEEMVRRGVNVPIIANVDTRFAINDNTTRISVEESMAGSSNPNWMGNQIGPLNVPFLPTIKDFEGVGIVTVRSTAVESLGEDNQYRWVGNTVNYHMLMEEAQRINAHAIINVVIDYVDNIERNEVIRELAYEHEWTSDELDKMSRGILRELITDEGRFAVEVSHVIRRTYFGSALAIRYREGINYLEAEALRAVAEAEANAGR